MLARVIAQVRVMLAALPADAAGDRVLAPAHAPRAVLAGVVVVEDEERGEHAHVEGPGGTGVEAVPAAGLVPAPQEHEELVPHVRPVPGQQENDAERGEDGKGPGGAAHIRDAPQHRAAAVSRTPYVCTTASRPFSGRSHAITAAMAVTRHSDTPRAAEPLVTAY